MKNLVKYGEILSAIDPRYCAKVVVVAIIVKDEKYYVGSNWCRKPQKECPRKGMKSGEGYKLCKEICEQENHAEEEAILKAGVDSVGAKMYLLGHYFACPRCIEASEKAGIQELIIGGYPIDKEFFK